MTKFIKSNALLILILLLAAFFRFWKISSLPGGLFPDEAANGLDVNSILGGQLQPFYERGNGREGLFFYFLALSVALFGRGPWQHHLVSGLFGFAAVMVTYFLTKRLFGKNVALLAAFFMAISSYAVTLSRTAFRANTIPFFAALSLLLLVIFFQTRNEKTRVWAAVGSGVIFALGFYTYIAFRMMVPLLAVLALILFFAHRDKLKTAFRAYGKHLFIFIASFLVAFAPLGYYFWAHPGTFVGRAGQVSIFSNDLNQGDVAGTFIEVFKKTILSFFTEGDLNWRHNVSGFPFLPPLVAWLFAAGLIAATLSIWYLLKDSFKKNITPQTFYLSLVALWFWFMMVPEVTTAEGIPHGLRLVGVIPAIFILPAWAGCKIWEIIKNFPPIAKIRYPLIALFLAGVLFYNYQLYFKVAASSPDYYYAFRSDLTVVSSYLQARNLKNKTYLSLDKFSVQTVDYLTTETGNPYILVDPAHTYEVRLNKGDQVVFTQST
ncbi:MAG: glycosyltransferase family 39 protein, partial [bacterium]|nr:glycosyltransferase family 39 protein [bacterium]